MCGGWGVFSAIDVCDWRLSVHMYACEGWIG